MYQISYISLCLSLFNDFTQGCALFSFHILHNIKNKNQLLTNKCWWRYPPQWLYHGRLQSYLFGGYDSKNDLKYLVYLIKTPQSGTLESWFFLLKKNRIIQEWWRNKMKMSYFSCYTTQTNWCHIFYDCFIFLTNVQK